MNFLTEILPYLPNHKKDYLCANCDHMLGKKREVPTTKTVIICLLPGPLTLKS
jgi:hypothetical protein